MVLKYEVNVCVRGAQDGRVPYTAPPISQCVFNAHTMIDVRHSLNCGSGVCWGGLGRGVSRTARKTTVGYFDLGRSSGKQRVPFHAATAPLSVRLCLTSRPMREPIHAAAPVPVSNGRQNTSESHVSAQTPLASRRRWDAEREGFEPSVPVKVHWFSRPAHSATLSPLRCARQNPARRRRMIASTSHKRQDTL